MFASLRRHRNYRLFFAGQIVSLTGTWMQDTALPWLVVQQTHSALDVGILMFCRYVPFGVFGLYAGVLADRFDNRRLMILTQSSSMAAASVLTVLAYGGRTEILAVDALAFIGGAATVFDAPTRHALTYQLVGRGEVANAVALNSGLMNSARLAGPALAGVLIAVSGTSACFLINTASFLVVIAMLVLMRPAELFPVRRDASPPATWSAIRHGLGYLRSDSVLKVVLATTAVGGLIGFNFRVLLPILAAETPSLGPRAFGLLYACCGAGALAGALVSTSIATEPTWVLAGMALFSGLLASLGEVHSVALAGTLLFGLGLSFAVWMAVSQALLQLGAPDQLRGRVMSVYITFWGGLTPIGALLSGWLADAGGTSLAFVASGVCGLTAVALAAIALHQSVSAVSSPTEVPDG